MREATAAHFERRRLSQGSDFSSQGSDFRSQGSDSEPQPGAANSNRCGRSCQEVEREQRAPGEWVCFDVNYFAPTTRPGFKDNFPPSDVFSATGQGSTHPGLVAVIQISSCIFLRLTLCIATTQQCSGQTLVRECSSRVIWKLKAITQQFPKL